MDTGISVYINTKLQKLPAQASIKDLLEALSIASRNGIALAVNNIVIPKSDWDQYLLAAEDNVTLIKATQGG